MMKPRLKYARAAFLWMMTGFFLVMVTSCSTTISQPVQSNFSDITLPLHLESDQVVLIVQGKIKEENPVKFDLDTIEQFPEYSFESYDPWDEKIRKYEGARLIDILTFLQIDDSATQIRIVGTNGYEASFSMTDLKRINYLLSYKMDDLYYHEQDEKDNKGPLAIAIDFDTQVDLDQEIYKQQLVWWISTITVE